MSEYKPHIKRPFLDKEGLMPFEAPTPCYVGPTQDQFWEMCFWCDRNVGVEYQDWYEQYDPWVPNDFTHRYVFYFREERHATMFKLFWC